MCRAALGGRACSCVGVGVARASPRGQAQATPRAVVDIRPPVVPSPRLGSQSSPRARRSIRECPSLGRAASTASNAGTPGDKPSPLVVGLWRVRSGTSWPLARGGYVMVTPRWYLLMCVGSHWCQWTYRNLTSSAGLSRTWSRCSVATSMRCLVSTAAAVSSLPSSST